MSKNGNTKFDNAKEEAARKEVVKAPMKKIKFSKLCRVGEVTYNKGEIAGFSESVCDDIISQKFGASAK